MRCESVRSIGAVGGLCAIGAVVLLGVQGASAEDAAFLFSDPSDGVELQPVLTVRALPVGAAGSGQQSDPAFVQTLTGAGEVEVSNENGRAAARVFPNLIAGEASTDVGENVSFEVFVPIATTLLSRELELSWSLVDPSQSQGATTARFELLDISDPSSPRRIGSRDGEPRRFPALSGSALFDVPAGTPIAVVLEARSTGEPQPIELRFSLAVTDLQRADVDRDGEVDLDDVLLFFADFVAANG